MDRQQPERPAAHAHPGAMPHHRLRRLEAFVRLLDDRYRIPGTSWRFGLDSVLGLIPGVGDTLTAGLATWLLAEAYRAGAPKRLLANMLVNIGVDYLVGTVPLVGDIFDVAFKANRRNLELLQRHLQQARRLNVR